MPTPAENLNKSASQQRIREAISATISQLVNEGREQQQAVAIAFSQAERAIGRKLQRKSRNPDADERSHRR